MFFCDNCEYLYDIKKTAFTKSDSEISGNIDIFFEKFLNNVPIQLKDIEKLTPAIIINDNRYEDMSMKLKKKLSSTIKAIDSNFFNSKEEKDNTNNAYFVCKKCKFNKKIKPGTIIYTKNVTENHNENVNYKILVNDNTLARSKSYICQNKKCESHNDKSNREVVMTKMESGNIVYICTVCTHNWIYK